LYFAIEGSFFAAAMTVCASSFVLQRIRHRLAHDDLVHVGLHELVPRGAERFELERRDLRDSILDLADRGLEVAGLDHDLRAPGIVARERRGRRREDEGDEREPFHARVRFAGGRFASPPMTPASRRTSSPMPTNR
jgi:hypothetical protein